MNKISSSNRIHHYKRIGLYLHKIFNVNRSRCFQCRIITLKYLTRRMAIANWTCVSFCIFCPPWVRPWDNRGKCYMDGKRIQCWSKALQHVPIYLQPFTSYSEMLVWNCNFFLPPCIVFPLEFRGKFGPHKTRIMWLPGSEDSLTIG